MRRGALILLLAGCNPNGEDPIDDIPDPFEDAPEYDTACDGYDGTPIAGAMGWFVGNFRVFNDDTVEGTEVWALIANDTWVETGEGMDCQLVWNVAGIVEDPQGCVSCDYAITIDAQPSVSASTCHDRFYQAEGLPFTETYNVRILQDNTAEFLYTSGALLGTGTAQGDTVSYESDPRCFFF